MSLRPSSWSFGSGDVREIERILMDYLRETKAVSALLIDRNGQLVLGVGDLTSFDPVSFSSLAAADFAANDQLAAMIGEDEFSSLVHQGKKGSMFLADVAKKLILVILFDNNDTNLGLVRLRVRGVVGELARLFLAILERSSASGGASPFAMQGFTQEADEEIDRLFGDL